MMAAIRPENQKRKKGTAVTATYSKLPNKLVSAANGIDYARLGARLSIPAPP
jgi:hypothetical protein